MIWKSRMVLATPGPLLTPPPGWAKRRGQGGGGLCGIGTDTRTPWHCARVCVCVFFGFPLPFAGLGDGYAMQDLPSGKNSRYFHTLKGMKQTHKGMKNHCFSRKHVFHTLKKHFIPLCNCCIPWAHFSYLGHIFHTLCICFIPWYYWYFFIPSTSFHTFWV